MSRPRRWTRWPRQKIEDLIIELKKDYTIVIVTHNMQQAARVIGFHRVFLPGRTGGIRGHHEDFHQPDPKTHGRLRDGTVRLS